MQGIYKITNKTNNQCYVGQSIDIDRRWYNHRTSDLNYPLYWAINKHGIENFEFIVLEEVKDANLLTSREQYWYQLLQPQYNGVSPKQNSTNFLQKKVLQIDKETLQIVKEHDGVNEAAREVNGHAQNISAVCNRKLTSAHNYYWCHSENYDSWTPKKNTTKKAVYKINKNTQEIVAKYESVREAARQHNNDAWYIIKACRDKRVTTQGHKWSYVEDYNQNDFRENN